MDMALSISLYVIASLLLAGMTGVIAFKQGYVTGGEKVFQLLDEMTKELEEKNKSKKYIDK